MSKLKRLASPKFWPIERKKKRYVVKPKPGPHSLEKSLPLGIIIRDVLHYAENKNVEKVIKYDKGNLGIIIEGKNVGVIGKIRKIIVTKSPKPNMVTLEGKEKIAVPKDFVFVIGEDKPVIDLE